MRFSLGQFISQKQIQKLAPRMIQSMEILQLPVLELQERIDQEMTENPVLEEIEQESAELEGAEALQAAEQSTQTEGEQELVVDEDSNNADDFERLDDMDQEIPDYFDEVPRTSVNRVQEFSDRYHDTMANISQRGITLYDHLLLQLRELDLEDDLFAMAERIASTLDAQGGGYLTIPLESLLRNDLDDQQLVLAQQALVVLQQLDPVGVAARDLEECLLLQLSEKHPFYRELHLLITNHLEDLEHNRLPLIQKQTGMSIEDIQLIWEELRHLNPKPASSFVEKPVVSVVPDLFVQKDDNEQYVVTIEERDIPQLCISDYYRRRLKAADANSDEKEFLRRKLNGAQWLIDAIHQRQATLLKVSQAIVDHQYRVIDDGLEAIIPLKMQQIADKVGVHVTTVSRAVDDKWVQTPRGIFPLRGFFVGGTTGDDGEDVAWGNIRTKLQEIIDSEDKAKPYSDDELVRQLKEAGLSVARRTVTKYRKKMGIPSSRQRKDWGKTAPS
ncbi:MAG: RNA polymerase sigma-54 factor [Planctomycetaceae bacterium]|nr:RNA polymerase sigma-54 factor [Planctomycetaceae bacterium]|tara:strand:- start:2317 stop:3819 length:1503 start_codon:yes stop_codon:yes gene_type:complete